MRFQDSLSRNPFRSNGSGFSRDPALRADESGYGFWLSSELRGERKARQPVQNPNQNPEVGIDQEILVKTHAGVTDREEYEELKPENCEGNRKPG